MDRKMGKNIPVGLSEVGGRWKSVKALPLRLNSTRSGIQ